MAFILREYTFDGRKYRIYAPGKREMKALELYKHNTAAHAANGNQAGVFREFASFLTVVLVPEGVDPARNREEAEAEILRLPFGVIIEVMADIVSMAKGGR